MTEQTAKEAKKIVERLERIRDMKGTLSRYLVYYQQEKENSIGVCSEYGDGDTILHIPREEGGKWLRMNVAWFEGEEALEKAKLEKLKGV